MKKLYFLKYGFLVCFIYSSIAVFAQTGSISGVVRDEMNQPLPGASVSLKGQTKSTSTGNDGRYKLTEIATGSQTIVVTFIGYQPQTRTISISAVTEVNFQLQASSSFLNEVVVVGYGTQRRRDVTGSVTTIASKDLNPGPITNPLQQIAGKAAGVNITQTGSEPGSAPSVRIRGITSLIGGNDPLIVVDGNQGGLDLLSQLPPSEIANIEVLKDASATAIYGSRGATGVIIVTTKKSKAGSTIVEYNAVSSIDVISKQLELLDANEWWTEAQKWGVTGANNHGANTDWFGLLTRNGSTQNHNVAMGGGTDNFNYRASVSAILQDGIVINSKNQNYIGRLQATQKALNNKLTVNMNLNTSFRNNTGSPTGIGRAIFRSNLISNAYVTRPTDPVYNTDGTYFIPSELFEPNNPYAIAQTVQNDGKINDTQGSLRADLEVASGLTAGVFGSWRKLDENTGYFLPAESTDATAINDKGSAEINSKQTNEQLLDLSLNYKKTFGDHSLDVIGVYEWQNQLYQGSRTRARGFGIELSSYNDLRWADITKVRAEDLFSYKNDRTLISYLGRVNYSYLDRYLLTASIRRDGSSVFGANHKWGNFPSASLAWRVDQEPFMKNQKVFNSLKLRGSYGVTGNQQGLVPQKSLNLVGIGSPSTVYFGGELINNYATIQNENPELRWETKYQTNIGLDFSVLNSRLSGTFDAFTATTKNLLFDYAVPSPPFEYTSIVANVGSVLNKGLEASLSYDVIKTDNTTLTLVANGSLLKNEVLSLSGTIGKAGTALTTDYVAWGNLNSSYLIVGKPIGAYYILQHEGIDPATGQELVVDQDGNGIIDQGNESPDRVLSGQALPKYNYAFTPSFSYKSFDVSMVWRGAGGNKIYNSIRKSLTLMENIGKSNMLKSAIPEAMFTSPYGSDFWLENGSYLRFENLTLGYRFNVSKLTYIKGVRLTLTANNLALFTKYSGIDPEVAANGGNNASTDNGIYPRVRSFALGLNISLK
ncbi:SusC/RagA family TonB-linked outer membrane protein [Arcticibacter eurypsychrophilus]|uniref:SusC/RagA family TonB-linked outer membrane protein n=1 Tax=Arcticibacter eurypsychrophilus TaxID=1434752 RepID=UPI00084D13C8|nr:TonB-dependent receptor [Arcticibacter eurypsychrophilus]